MLLSTSPYPSSNQNDINSLSIKINTSTSSPTISKRKDTLQIKQKLSEALGPNSKEYWKCLKNYLTGKLSKNEFDKSIKNLIGDQLQLHNSLIYSIIYNSQRDIIPRDGSLLPISSANSDSKERNSLKRKHKLNKVNGNVKRMKLKDEFLSLEKIDRDKIRGLLKKYPSPKNEIPTFSSHFIPKPSKNIPPSFKDIQDVPGINDSLLKERVEFVASLEGISSITDEALVLMSYALRSRLKGIIENCLSKRINNEQAIETPITPIIPLRRNVYSSLYEESDSLINQQPLPTITVTDLSTKSINNTNINITPTTTATPTTTITGVTNNNDKKENISTDIKKENIDNHTKEQQIKDDISSTLSNNLIEDNKKDTSEPLTSTNNMDEKTEDEKKKDVEHQEKKEEPSSSAEIADKNVDHSTDDNKAKVTINDTKNKIPLLRDKILKVKASLQKKLQKEGQYITTNVVNTMKPGTLLCDRSGFIEVSKEFSNGIKPNSSISIETLDTLPLPNLISSNGNGHKNRAEEIFKICSKGSLETIKENEDENNIVATTEDTSMSDINATIAPSSSMAVNPLLSALPSTPTTSLLKDVKQENEEKESFNAISKDDDLFNAILSSSDILNHDDLLDNTFDNTLLPSTTSITSLTPTTAASSSITPSSTVAVTDIAPMKESSLQATEPSSSSTTATTSNVNITHEPLNNSSLLTDTTETSSIKFDYKNNRNEDEIFSEFDIDANFTQNHLISLQDVFFAHEINPQHIFGNSAYSSEVLENLICVLAENDHSLIE
ncbi:hypothetical protein BCR36DRAFT_342159 [Piromyces finnis]|uniref:Transcriptional regulator of RNA polII, SAGA, subunit n=1 Tax=Piromyces finnis TaxID=1754191 RepID=A0A1Y1VM13_9FUNG|nr:hypothetical protein BCR36DRAFT_342159 [Piromyces finnis]|eukprot:ORX59967.1 hypothetical protein BCR36DRAFT_342159 [Piromyces finnis]